MTSTAEHGISNQPRRYPEPTKTGKVPFAPPGLDGSTQCETVYWLFGDLDGTHPPLICLHGGPGIPSRSLISIALLHQDRGIPVILYDQIGCGESTHLPQTKGNTDFWTMDLFLAELRNLISHLGIKTYDLLGHSFGGMEAASFCLTQPPGLRKVIIYSAPASVPLRRASTKRQRAALPLEIRETLAKGEENDTTASPEYKAAMNQFYQRHMCRISPFPQVLMDSLALMAQDDTVYSTMYGNTPMHLTGPMQNFDIIPDLERITEKTVPGGILIVNGRYDTTTDESTAPYFTKPKAKVKWVQMAESGHSANLEETERFLYVVGEFLMME